LYDPVICKKSKSFGGRKFKTTLTNNGKTIYLKKLSEKYSNCNKGPCWHKLSFFNKKLGNKKEYNRLMSIRKNTVRVEIQKMIDYHTKKISEDVNKSSLSDKYIHAINEIIKKFKPIDVSLNNALKEDSTSEKMEHMKKFFTANMDVLIYLNNISNYKNERE
jgi:hypothetical protein